MMQPSKGSNNDTKLSKSDVITGAIILICAQLAAASTASCCKALPNDTPMVLRGLWRQTLTSCIFAIFTLILYLRNNSGNDSGCISKKSNEDEDILDEKTYLMSSSKKSEEQGIGDTLKSILEDYGYDEEVEGDALDEDSNLWLSPTHIGLVLLAVVGATLLNDTIVVALQFASSAAVMCLCNTTPIWLILYAVVSCRAPGAVTMFGALVSLLGTVICATGGEGGDQDSISQHDNESLGAIIATFGGLGGAIYMTACRKLNPCGISLTLSLLINIGMMITTYFLCLGTLKDGVNFFSTDIHNGFFGFINRKANSAAILHSLFPDLMGNFGIMISLYYFEPLIVSMIMLTEPLNASLIAMYTINEAPPSFRTVIGVIVALSGCGIVLWESNIDAKEELEEEDIKEETTEDDHLARQLKHRSVVERKRRNSAVLYANLGQVSPSLASRFLCKGKLRTRRSMPYRAISGTPLISDSSRKGHMKIRSSIPPSIFGNTSFGDMLDTSIRKVMLMTSLTSEKEEEGDGGEVDDRLTGDA